jgi:streptogramin lyase
VLTAPVATQARTVHNDEAQVIQLVAPVGFKSMPDCATIAAVYGVTLGDQRGSGENCVGQEEPAACPRGSTAGFCQIVPVQVTLTFPSGTIASSDGAIFESWTCGDVCDVGQRWSGTVTTATRRFGNYLGGALGGGGLLAFDATTGDVVTFEERLFLSKPCDDRPCVGRPAPGAPLGEVAEFNAGLGAGASPAAITPAADGNLWFSDRGSPARVGRITPDGTITEFTGGLNPGASPRVIAQGPNGALYVADGGTHPGIATIGLDGAITESALTPGSSPDGVVTGPDNAVWFTDRGLTAPAIGRIAPDGSITRFTTGLNPGSSAHAIAVGPDGNLWFADAGTTPAVGRVTPNGTITEFSVGLNPGSAPDAIVRGPDGNLWFTDIGRTKAIGRITTDGVITEFTAGLNAGAAPRGITAAPDGNIWFTDQGKTAAIGRITTDGAITEFAGLFHSGAVPFRIATGADGNLWFTDAGATKAVARFGIGEPAAEQDPPTIKGNDRGTLTCVGDRWSTWAGTQPSHDAFSFDGYQWLRDGTPVATGRNYAPVPADVGHALACSVTVTYTLFNATVAATSAPIHVLH